MEYLIGGAAVLISAISLQVAVNANRTQEKLLAASTWPHVQYGTGNRLEDGTDSITLSLQNAGVGPARLHWVRVSYLGKPQSDAAALLDACCGPSELPRPTITTSTERVLTPGAELTFFRYDLKTDPAGTWPVLNDARFDVRVQACYCSVLEDCWTLDSEGGEPAPVAACPAVPETERWHG
ncbi:MAG: hypothetical protein KA187_03195 [Arenimonas sp.]|nr:hypothetical protein [Arenimonas sp.]